MDFTEIASLLLATAQGYASATIAAMPRVLAAALVLLVTWAAVALARTVLRRMGRRMRLRSNLVQVLMLVATVGLWLAGSLIALTLVFPSITPGKALTTLGLGSVAIGFAFKDTFENFLAGILILLREPFQIGDFVEVNDTEGKIEDITMRDTRIRQTDGQLVVMPNHDLFQNPVTVRTNRELRRTTVICGVAYHEDVDAARAVIWEAVRHVDSVRDDVKDVQVFAQSFGASSIDFEVTWWTGSEPIDIRTSRDQVVAAVKSALDREGIEIPFPYRTLTVNEPIPVRSVPDAQNNDASPGKAAQ